jgi:glycosyltransferase involved in cell wall biosynthesis
MRVACVNQDPGVQPGKLKGAVVHVQAMREAFAACDVEVAAFDTTDDSVLRQGLEDASRDGSLGLVYERYALGCDAASRFAMQHGIPHVLEVNAPLLDEAARYRGLSEAADLATIEERVLRFASMVLAVSTEVRDVVLARGVLPDSVRVQPNAVDTERFIPRPPGVAVPDLDIPDSDFVLGFHGRLRPWHNIGQLIEAAALLLERGVPAHVLLVGAGDWHEHTDGRLPPERCTVIGWQPHSRVARLVARFDALALTYSPDTPCYFSPLKLLEAMSVEAVPVVPELGDLPAVVQHESNGLLYPAGDTEALVDALERIAVHPALRRSLGGAARETARGRSWTAVAANVLDSIAAGAWE